MQQMRFNSYNTNGQRIKGTYSIHRYDIGSGDSAIYKTVDWMVKLVQKDANLPVVKSFAKQLTQGAGTDLEKINAVFEWVKNNVRYIKDGKLSQIVKEKSIWYTNQFFKNPEQTEVLSSPHVLIETYLRGKTPQEDCDGMTMLTNALLKSIGIKTAMKIVSTQKNLAYNHVYGMAFDKQNSKWWAIDAIKPYFKLGQEPINDITRSFVVEV